MTPRHATSETLAAYASGALPSGARLVVSVHLRACPSCRAAAARFSEVGGAMLAQTDAAPLAPRALERTLARLDESPAHQSEPHTLDQVLASGVWIPFGPRLAIKGLSRFADEGERFALIRAAPGQALPEHGHNGVERLVVIRGAFEDDWGRYGAGDLSERGPEDRHQPIASSGDTCVCLSATEGPLRLTGLARWLQPILGL
jgi:putative transcriptional regulator